MHVKTFDRFYKEAKVLRAEFERRFADPRVAHAGRFVWDYWHVPDQYTLLRTPAHGFFANKVYERFHRHLVEWGRANLGCHDISPPWLSCYVNGCKQEIHSDVPHGPLAFVYSLTPRPRFRGGRTFLLRDHPRGLEKRDLLKTIAPTFNRLIVFDPSVPHGVEEVEGTNDPRDGRLVIHGWFVNPRPFWYGALKSLDVSRSIEDGLGRALSGELNLGRGLISLRLSVGRGGEVNRLHVLVSTLHGGDPRAVRELQTAVRALRFPKKRAQTELTLPLLVD